MALQNGINANATSPLKLTQGGSQASLTASNGGIVYSNATQMQILAGTATAGQIIRSGSTAAPTWSTATFASTYGASELLYSNGANAVAGLATANSAVLVTAATGVPVWSATMTDGQLIIGDTAGTPTAATLTAGTGISIVNAAGAITINNTAAGQSWSVVTTNQTLADNVSFAANDAAQLSFALPAVAAVGDTFEVLSSNTGGFIITQGAGQQVIMGNVSSTLGAAGTTASNSTTGDWIELVCIVANNIFYANAKQGEFDLL